MKKIKNIRLSKYDLLYVMDRVQALKLLAGDRNDRMGRFEKLYRLDVWKDAPSEGQVRVTLPIAFDVVEKMRGLLITRPPQINVPTVSPKRDDQENAQRIERYCYGVMSRTNLMRVMADAEWFAMCLGQGILRLTYDASAPDDDFPLVVMAPDPRTVYGRMSANKDRFVEVAHVWERSRSEIQEEWGVELPRPDSFDDADADAEYLDEKVNYIEYWVESSEWESEDYEESEDMPDVPSVIEMASELIAGVEHKEKEEREPRERRVRKIIHMVCVEDGGEDGTGTVIKKASIVPGYKQIPYLKWSGISTPLPGAMSDLSVLYPLANGDGGESSYGILAAWSIMASMDMTEVVKMTHPPLVSDAPDVTVSLEANAVNSVPEGRTIKPIYSPGESPAIQRVSEQLSRMVDRVSIPEVYGGQMAALSGQAISGFATAFQMLIGFKQQDRERALEQFFGLALSLTREYADPVEGWTAFGSDAHGKYREETVVPGDIKSTCRVRVNLSASMPRDDNAELIALSQLLSARQISLETFLDKFQKLKGLASESPVDEMERILRDGMLMDSDMAKQLANVLASEYAQLLGGGLNAAVNPQMMMQSQMLSAPQMQPQGMGGLPGGSGAEFAPGEPGSQVAATSGNLGVGADIMATSPQMLEATGNIQAAANLSNKAKPNVPGLEGIL